MMRFVEFFSATLALWINTVGVLLPHQNAKLTCLGYPRARGPGPDDQTSYLPIERDWGLERPDGWDRILDQILYRFERNDYEPPTWLRREPGYMMHNGRIVIDRNNQ